MSPTDKSELGRPPRVPFVHSVEFSIQDMEPSIRLDGIAQDISLGGMFIQTEVIPALGEHLVVYVTLPRAARELALPAVVRWTLLAGMGVQFGPMGGRDRDAITEFVRAVERR
jgi:hypothetical protein